MVPCAKFLIFFTFIRYHPTSQDRKATKSTFSSGTFPPTPGAETPFTVRKNVAMGIIIIISKSYIVHVSTKQGTQSAEYIQTFRKVITVMNSETQLCITLKGFTRCYDANSSHSQEHRCESLLFSISALGCFTCPTQHMGPTALRPISRTQPWLSVLLKDTSVTDGDSNPHSADQKHQSLNSVLLTSRPRHSINNWHDWRSAIHFLTFYEATMVTALFTPNY